MPVCDSCDRPMPCCQSRVTTSGEGMFCHRCRGWQDDECGECGEEPNVSDQTTEQQTKKDRRGFGSMSPEKQREIASRGGKAAHKKGTAHEWTSHEAREAGRRGGTISRGGRGRLPSTEV